MEEQAEETSPLMENRSESKCLLARHTFAFMGFLGFANIYAMRVNLSVAIVAMVNSTALAPNGTVVNNNTCPIAPAPITDNTDGPFNWNEQQQGLILGSFFYGYVLTQLPGGRLAELWGGKWLYGLGVLVTAIFTLLTPWAAQTSAYMLVAVRIMEGLGEGVTFPAMHAMLAKWSPPNERSKMGSRVYSGAQFGTVISLPISGILANKLGWESVFYVFGVLGIIWFVFWWWLVYDTPQSHPTISRQEKEFILRSLGTERGEPRPKSVPWRSVLTSVPVWALVVTHMAQNWGFYTLLTELPTYMKNILHFNIKANAFVSALPYLIMWLMALLSSVVADYVLDKNLLSRAATRKTMNSLAMCLPALFLVFAAYSGCNVTYTVVFLALAGGMNGMHYSGFMSTHIDMSPNFAGTLLGITNGFSNIMGFLAPGITGYIINGNQDLPHWRTVFFIAAVVYFVGNTVFLVFGSTQEQKWNRGDERRDGVSYQALGTSDAEDEALPD